MLCARAPSGVACGAMRAYIIKRLGEAVITLLVVSVGVFMLSHLTGDPAIILAPPDASQGDIEEIRQNLKLDRPIFVQYWHFLRKALTGDFGRSWVQGRPVLTVIGERLPNTVTLAGVALAMSLAVGLTLGVVSALKPEGFVDSFAKVFALGGQSIPTFWTGIILILLFAVTFKLLPTSGIGTPKHLVLPAITLSWFSTAALLRLTRSAMLDVLDSEFIKMVRIKGAPEWHVIGKHALKNASLPIITLISLQFVGLLNGAVVTETVFAWPGIGRLVVQSVFSRDFPVVQAIVLMAGTLFIVTNLLVDIMYAYLDPRIKYG